jgi:Asp-tRNA(Asn)/Glu-tRNA(Gln) amidotransferase A subunit family amidase
VISIPAGTGAEGLPVGVQLAGRRGDEAALLQLAASLVT